MKNPQGTEEHIESTKKGIALWALYSLIFVFTCASVIWFACKGANAAGIAVILFITFGVFGYCHFKGPFVFAATEETDNESLAMFMCLILWAEAIIFGVMIACYTSFGSKELNFFVDIATVIGAAWGFYFLEEKIEDMLKA